MISEIKPRRFFESFGPVYENWDDVQKAVDNIVKCDEDNIEAIFLANRGLRRQVRRTTENRLKLVAAFLTVLSKHPAYSNNTLTLDQNGAREKYQLIADRLGLENMEIRIFGHNTFEYLDNLGKSTESCVLDTVMYATDKFRGIVQDY